MVTLAESGIAEHYISVMPDVHLGKGATVGTVFASSNYVSPNAVGVDIGCGMCAVPIDGLSSNDLTPTIKQQIFSLMKERIPTGFNSYDNPLKDTNQKLEKISEEQRPTKYLIEKIDSRCK